MVRFFSSLSASARLLLVLMLVVLPFGAYTLYSYYTLEEVAQTVSEEEWATLGRLLESTQKNIEAMAVDYSEAYARAPDGLQKGVLSHPDDIDLFSVYDAEGRLLATTRPDIHLPYPLEVASEPITGYALTDAGLFMVSISPILHSNHTGAPSGLVVVGRALDDAWVEHQSSITSLNFSIVPPGEGGRVLYDLASKPVAMLTLTPSSDVLSRALSRWLWTTVLLGIVGVLVAFTMVHGTLLLPFGRLKAAIACRIESCSTEPIEPVGYREVDELAECINELIERQRESLERLKSAYEEVRALSELKSEFVGILAHQIRAPLAVCMGNLGLMVDGAFGELTDAQRERIQLILTQHMEFKWLVDRLSLLVEVEHKRLTPDYEHVNVGALLREVMDEMHPMMLSRAQRLTTSISEPLDVMADRRLLKSAIMELVHNAVVHSGEGTHIELGAMLERDLVRIDVWDDGVGIPKSVMSTMFEPLCRDSAGLGLSIVKGIMDAHGGMLELKSIEGRGTVVTLLIPIEPEKD